MEKAPVGCRPHRTSLGVELAVGGHWWQSWALGTLIPQAGTPGSGAERLSRAQRATSLWAELEAGAPGPGVGPSRCAHVHTHGFQVAVRGGLRAGGQAQRRPRSRDQGRLGLSSSTARLPGEACLLTQGTMAAAGSRASCWWGPSCPQWPQPRWFPRTPTSCRPTLARSLCRDRGKSSVL